MNRLLLCIFFVFSSLASYQQPNYLFIKKGIHKKKTFSEGDRIHVQLQNGQDKKGMITMLRDNVVYINDTPIPKEQIAMVIVDGKGKKPFPADFKTMLLIGGGVALTAIGLSLNNQNTPKAALIAAAGIGYGPLLIKHFGGRFFYLLHRKKFRVGKKFRLQVFDLYVPGKKAF